MLTSSHMTSTNTTASNSGPFPGVVLARATVDSSPCG